MKVWKLEQKAKKNNFWHGREKQEVWKMSQGWLSTFHDKHWNFFYFLSSFITLHLTQAAARRDTQKTLELIRLFFVISFKFVDLKK